MSLYSLIATGAKAKPAISLSQVANDIKAGQVTTIKETGDNLLITYSDGSQKTSMKDPNDALPQTLVPYGVTSDALSKVQLTIATDTGFLYWLETLGPLLFSALLLGILFWFLARQIRGAGMQAFTFGQSKARMIDPEDNNSRVTFVPWPRLLVNHCRSMPRRRWRPADRTHRAESGRSRMRGR